LTRRRHWMAGAVTEDVGPGLDPGDPGLVHGEGLYETLLVERGKALFLDQHLERMERGATFLGIPNLPSVLREVRAAVSALVDQAGDEALRLRLVLTRGLPGAGPRVLGTLEPLDPSSKGSLSLGSVRHLRHPGIPTGCHKLLGRIVFRLSLEAARERGHDEGLLLDARGHVAECSHASVFWVKDGILFTPGLEIGILPGVVRQQVLEIAGEASLEVRPVRAHLVAVSSADEIFVTSSLRGVVPARDVDGFATRSGSPGPQTARIAAAYEDRKFW